MRGTYRPRAYHGRTNRRPFFEGWYVKVVSADLRHRIAVIPGIFLGGGRDDEAFVQVLDGSTGNTQFHPFAPSAFVGARDRFDVRVGECHFGEAGFTVDLPGLTGRVDFATSLDPWPVRPLEIGPMGWYGLVPFMQCYHGVVSFGHDLRGHLVKDGLPMDFDGGRGYIEKDWGSAFPEGYVWLHSNHLSADASASLVASVAVIPWLSGAFRGFFVGLKHGGALYRWATYRRSKERSLDVDDHGVRWELTGPDGTLQITAERARGGVLHAPDRTAMHRRVEETLDAAMHVVHADPSGRVVFDSQAGCGALEVSGDIERLLDLARRS